jgi:hypothetical protein
MIRLLALLLLPLRRALAPPAPGRFSELTRLFRVAFPDADGDRWEAHCEQLAEAAYWEGERRGYDRARGLDEGALRARHDWAGARDRPPLADALAGLRSPEDPLAGATPEQLAAIREHLREGGTFELRVTPGEG